HLSPPPPRSPLFPYTTLFRSEDDPGSKPRITMFLQRLEQLNWTVDHNVKIDIRWGAVDAAHARKGAAELVALAPDDVDLYIMIRSEEHTSELQSLTNIVCRLL